MEKYSILPNEPIVNAGPIAKAFLDLKIDSFLAACRYVHELPYGYNSNRDDLMILFKENKGSCATKHAVIATLANELNVSLFKHIGIYAMTDKIVTGTIKILDAFNLPYLPMVHCFLMYNNHHRIDLSEGNANGKNGPINEFLYTVKVIPNIPEKEEYLLYRRALQDHILDRREFNGVELKTILKARELGVALLRSIVRK